MRRLPLTTPKATQLLSAKEAVAGAAASPCPAGLPPRPSRRPVLLRWGKRPGVHCTVERVAGGGLADPARQAGFSIERTKAGRARRRTRWPGVQVRLELSAAVAYSRQGLPASIGQPPADRAGFAGVFRR